MSARTLALRILGGFALLLIAIVLLFTRTDKTADRAAQNRAQIVQNSTAIPALCNLLRDLYLQLAGGDLRESNMPPSRTAQLVELRLGVLTRLMTEAERRRERRLVSWLASHGELAAVPDCEAITKASRTKPRR